MTIEEAYQKEVGGDLIPFYQVRGNKKFLEEFDGADYKLYEYCIEHKVKWEDVLDYVYNPDVLY